MSAKLWGVVVAVVAGLVLGVGPPAAAWEPDEGATFNVPRPWGNAEQRMRVIRKVDAAIEHTPAGATVLITSFLFDRPSSVDALVDACRRGVSVRVILDRDIKTKPARRLVAVLNGDNVKRDGEGGWTAPRTQPCGRAFRSPHRAAPLTGAALIGTVDDPAVAKTSWGTDESYVKRCRASCRGRRGNMHAKFYAFSATGQADHVVMVSSSNLNGGGASKGWNDLYTFTGRPASFAVYQQVHREMTEDDAGDDTEWFEVVDGPFTSRFFPWQGAGRAHDPVLDELNRIGCHGPDGPTKIHVSMFWWDGERGEYLARKLIRLAKDGCQVSIIHAARSRTVGRLLGSAARHHLVSLWDSRWDNDNDAEVEVRTHQKYVLVNGRYAGDPHSFQVMTGTANWNRGSLTSGDDNTLTIASRVAWRQYIANWNLVRRHSTKYPQRLHTRDERVLPELAAARSHYYR